MEILKGSVEELKTQKQRLDEQTQVILGRLAGDYANKEEFESLR